MTDTVNWNNNRKTVKKLVKKRTKIKWNKSSKTGVNDKYMGIE